MDAHCQPPGRRGRNTDHGPAERRPPQEAPAPVLPDHDPRRIDRCGRRSQLHRLPDRTRVAGTHLRNRSGDDRSGPPLSPREPGPARHLQPVGDGDDRPGTRIPPDRHPRRSARVPFRLLVRGAVPDHHHPRRVACRSRRPGRAGTTQHPRRTGRTAGGYRTRVPPRRRQRRLPVGLGLAVDPRILRRGGDTADGVVHRRTAHPLPADQPAGTAQR